MKTIYNFVQLQLETVEDNLKREEEKMSLINAKRDEQEKNRENINKDFSERCADPLQEVLTRILTEQQSGIAITNGLHFDDDAAVRVENIRNLLKNSDFETVSRMVIHLDACNSESRKNMSVFDQVLYFVVLLNSYLFDDYVSAIFRIFSFYFTFIFSASRNDFHVCICCYILNPIDKRT